MPERRNRMWRIAHLFAKWLRAAGICAVEPRDVEWNGALNRQA
jgi:hypothetical protein